MASNPSPPPDQTVEPLELTITMESKNKEIKDLRKTLQAKEEENVRLSKEVSKLRQELVEMEARKEAEAEQKMNQLRRLMLTGLKMSVGGGGGCGGRSKPSSPEGDDGLPEVLENGDKMLKEVMKLICGQSSMSSEEAEIQLGTETEDTGPHGKGNAEVEEPPLDTSNETKNRRGEDEKPQAQLEGDQRQKYDEMKIVASKSVKQLKSKMPTSLEEWLRDHLTSANVGEIGEIYSILLDSVLKEGYAQVDWSLWGELARIIDGDCKYCCFALLGEVQDRLLAFNEAMQGKFSRSEDSCFPTSELEKIGREEFGKVSGNLPPGPNQSEISKLVQTGCEKLMAHFINGNNGIVESKLSIAKASYREVMRRLLEDDVYTPSKLKEIHSGLVDKIITSFTTGFQVNPGSQIDQVEMLRALFDQEFALHLETNNSKLKLMQEKISKLLQKSKSTYIEKIEAVLARNPDGLEAREFQRTHQEIVVETRKLLGMAIRTASQVEPVEAYLKSLQAHINDYWKCVLESNKKNLRKGMERETKRLEEEEKQIRQRQPLPPLVFQLQRIYTY